MPPRAQSDSLKMAINPGAENCVPEGHDSPLTLQTLQPLAGRPQTEALAGSFVTPKAWPLNREKSGRP
jgi:hypothetical protein